MKKIDYIKDYFYMETNGLSINSIKLAETKSSYLFTTKCYFITTNEGLDFYLFDSDNLPMYLYQIRPGETIDECYYKHIGFMTELCSQTVSKYFVLEFLNRYSIFPILDRKLVEIDKEIIPSKNSTQLKGVANQIRDCYLDLTDYLMNKVRTENPNFKNDNFIDNFQEFLKRIIPEKQSETRRNVLNNIAQKGWILNSELVHKDSVTIFDICISFNILQLVISSINNLIVGNDVPLNKIKCPSCHGEKISMRKDSMTKEFIYICSHCKTKFTLDLEEMVKSFPEDE